MEIEQCPLGMERRRADLCRLAALERALERIVAWYDESGTWAEGDEPRAIALRALDGS